MVPTSNPIFVNNFAEDIRPGNAKRRRRSWAKIALRSHADDSVISSSIGMTQKQIDILNNWCMDLIPKNGLVISAGDELGLII